MGETQGLTAILENCRRSAGLPNWRLRTHALRFISNIPDVSLLLNVVEEHLYG